MNSSPEREGITIPFAEITSESLMALIEAFVLREGTDYGLNEVSMEQKANQILAQVRRGEVVIVFDPTDESCSLVRKEDLKCRPSI